MIGIRKDKGKYAELVSSMVAGRNDSKDFSKRIGQLTVHRNRTNYIPLKI